MNRMFGSQSKDSRFSRFISRRACALLLGTILPVLAAGRLPGASIQLAWDRSASTNASGYALYSGTVSSNYTKRVDVGNQTTGTITGLVAGVRYYLVVKAYTSSGVESLPSNELAYTVPSVASNQAPSLVIVTTALGYTEDAAATPISNTSTVSDPDSPEFNGGTLTVQFTANGSPADLLGISHQGTGTGQIAVSGSAVSFGGNTFGYFTGGTNGSSPLVIHFTNSYATIAAVQQLVTRITFRNSSDAPSTAARTVQFVLNDGDGGTDSASKTVNVTAINDAPRMLNAIPNQSVGYGTPFNYTFAANVFTDVDAGDSLTYTVAGMPAGVVFSGSTRSFAGMPTESGIFSVTVTATDTGNATATDTFGLTVGAAALTVSAANASRGYGATNPVFSGTVSGLVNGDNITVTCSPSATTNSPPGTYPFTVSLHDPGNRLARYVVTTNNGTLTVTQAVLVVRATDQARTYGAANPTLAFTYSGFVNGETAAVLESLPIAGTTATTASWAGAYPITLSGGSDPNYALIPVPGTLTISKAALTATANNTSRAYGTANPSLTVRYSGFVNGDTAAALDSPPLATTSATPASPTGTYPITLSGGTDNNYTLTLVDGTLSVRKVPLIATANNAGRIYGAANPVFTINYSGFVNGDTASALDVAPTASTTATTASPTGTYPITLSGGTDNFYDVILVDGTLTVGKAPLTVTANNTNRAQGATNPIFTISYSGFVNGETPAVIDTAPVATTPATIASPAGAYPIVLSGGNDDNYALTLVYGTLTVGKITLIATVNDVSRMYGAANPFLSIRYTGFVNGDTTNALNVLPVATTTANPTSAPGTYAITLSGGSDDFYDFVLFHGTLTVNKATLNVAVNAANRIYGAANPALTVSYSGFVNGDGPAAIDSPPLAATTATPLSSVGVYPITLSGGTDNNYSLILTPGTLTVGKAPLTATAESLTRTYGVANPPLAIRYSGFVNGETVSVLERAPVAGTTATVTSSTGGYPITLSGGEDDDYALSLVPGTLTITKAALTATANNTNRAYGTANPAFTISYSGLASGETASVIDNAPVVATTATMVSPLGTYPITLSGGSDNNYAFTLMNGVLTVGAGELVVSVASESRSYGATNPVFRATLSGLAAGDDITATCTSTATTNSPPGTYPLAVSLNDPANKLPRYTTTTDHGALTVTQALLVIRATDQTRTYGGENPALVCTYSGFVNGETISVLDVPPRLTTTATMTSPVGNYPITLSGGTDDNYALTLSNGTLSVAKATLIATANDANRTYGALNPAFTVRYSGFVNGDTASALDAPPTATATAISSSPVGTYPITPSGGSDTNYMFTLAPGTLTISKAPLAATADNLARTFGAANPVFTVSYSGFVNGDGPGVIDSLPLATTTATSLSSVGTYPITLSGGTDPNYAFSLTPGTLTVGKAPLTATADNLARAYGAANPPLTIRYTGFLNGDTAATIDSPPLASTTATPTSPTGTYPITLSGGSDNNYLLTLVNGSLSVGKVTLIATAHDASRTYGAANPSFAIRYSGFVNGDTESVLDQAPTAGTTATAASAAGTYAITLFGGSDNFYDLVPVDGTLTVGKASLIVRANDQSRAFNDANPLLTLNYTGFVNGDTVSDINVLPTAVTTATNGSPVGLYPITVLGGADDNYTLMPVSGTLTIREEVEFGFALLSTPGIYKRGNPPTRLDATAVLFAGGRSHFGNGSLTVTIISNASPGDFLAVHHGGTARSEIGVASDTVSYGPVGFAQFTGGASANEPLVLIFNSNATPEAVQALGRHLIFAASNSHTSRRVVEWVLTDGEGTRGTSTFKTVTIDSTPVQKGVTVAALTGKRVSVFNGLVCNANDVTPAQSGYFRLTAKSNGVFSGYVMQGKTRIRVAGQFNGGGQASVLGGAGAYGVDLELTAGTDAVRGMVTPYRTAGASTELFGHVAELSDTNLSGTYTLSIPGSTDPAAAPGGSGYATFKVDKLGNVKFTGSLANGRKVSQSSLVATNGQWPWHAPSKDGRSTLLGWLRLRDDTGRDVAGTLTWIEAASASAKFYPGGFAAELTAAGSRYTVPKATAPALNWSAGEFLAWGGNLSAVLTNSVALSSLGALTSQDGDLQRLKFKLNARSGALKGTFLHPETRRSVAYAGVLLQKSGRATGYFLGTNQSGAFHLQPGP